MKVLSVQPKGVYVTLEFSIEQIGMILEYLDHCIVSYDSKKESDMTVADGYVKDIIFAHLSKLHEDYSG